MYLRGAGVRRGRGDYCPVVLLLGPPARSGRGLSRRASSGHRSGVHHNRRFCRGFEGTELRLCRVCFEADDAA